MYAMTSSFLSGVARILFKQAPPHMTRWWHAHGKGVVQASLGSTDNPHLFSETLASIPPSSRSPASSPAGRGIRRASGGAPDILAFARRGIFHSIAFRCPATNVGADFSFDVLLLVLQQLA